jgi:DNA processing protein
MQTQKNQDVMSKSKPVLRDILLLLSIPGIGGGKVRQLLSIFPTAEEIIRAPIKLLTRVDGVDVKTAQLLKSGYDERLVDEQLAKLEKAGVDCVSIWDDEYPPLLKKAAAPPALLFYRGVLPPVWPAMIGVVGTRMPSTYGKTVTEKLTMQLVENGLDIVSGMARGVDTVAHTAAIKRGGKTYAVLGCGVDVIYPSENRKLYEQIVENGAVISEYFLGAKPDAVNFPRRNRIISGMSLGVLVVEAGKKSGALITAEFALEQNREVFAVPGQITNHRSIGSNKLIQQGAKLVQSVEDILEEISPKLRSQRILEKPLPPDLSEADRLLLSKLSTEPRHIDQLVLELDQSPAVLLGQLLRLELAGLVKQLTGKMFIRM